MVVNFRTRGISRGTRKLIRTSILIIIIKKKKSQGVLFVNKPTYT